MTLLSNANYADAVDEKFLPKKIIFGSCLDQHLPEKIWDPIFSEKADLFLFMGDNIYLDSEDPLEKKEAYRIQMNMPWYAKLFKESKVIGTWDDHDYGLNDSGNEYIHKKESQNLFLEFIQEPKNSERWNRNGVYWSIIYGKKPNRIQFILLDTRYFRSPLKTGWKWFFKTKYVPDYDKSKTMLGEEQWKWLESELKKEAEVRILVSSIQFLFDDHEFERWGNFPLERERMFSLIKSSGANGLIIFSGDRHYSEISRLTENVNYPLYEITESALNRPLEYDDGLDNKYRISSYYKKANYGKMEIDWAGKDTKLKFSIHDIDGKKIMGHDINLTEITK